MSDHGCANSTCTNSTCTNADHGCFDAQALCNTNQKATGYASHTWPEKFEKNQIIIQVLPRNVFNSAFPFITKALQAGKTYHTGDWSTEPETRDFIYADKVNEILQGLSKFENGCSITKAEPNSVITADYFTSIANALNNAEISKKACDWCNTSCEGCVDCEGCDGCEGCNSCQGHSTCHSPCHNPCDTPSP